jgi:hypothetical protein
LADEQNSHQCGQGHEACQQPAVNYGSADDKRSYGQLGGRQSEKRGSFKATGELPRVDGNSILTPPHEF